MKLDVTKIKMLEQIVMRHLCENEVVDNAFGDNVKHHALDVAMMMKLRKGHFTTIAFQVAYEAFLNIYASGQKITLLTTHERIGDHITDLDIVDLFDPHGNTRRLVALIGELLKGAWLRDAGSQLFSIYNEIVDWEPWKPTTSITSAFKNILDPPNFAPDNPLAFDMGFADDWANKMAIYLNGNHAKPILSGFRDIDSYLKGFMEGKFIVIAALAGCGKTALATNICLNVGSDYNPCLYITNEMDRYEIFDRMISTKSKINFTDIHQKTISGKQDPILNAAFEEMKKYPIMLCDESNGIWEKAESEIRRFSKERKIKVVFLDYLQQYRLEKKSQSRVAELTEITARIKCLSMELKLTMVVMSQMNRAIYSRDDKTPVLADLKESGSIEQDADCVIFLQDGGKTITAGKELSRVKVFIEKNRSGSRGNFELTGDMAINKFFSV